jgi:hypothetical protein
LSPRAAATSRSNLRLLGDAVAPVFEKFGTISFYGQLLTTELLACN